MWSGDQPWIPFTPVCPECHRQGWRTVVHSLYLGHPDNIVSPCGHVVTNAEAGEIARLFKAWEKYWDWYYRVGHPQ